ncbi:MAG: hypothetical protein JNK12_15305 [Acidimicrobiales bacterium]|nr:hypothetical protein [Acidimicrobiales bacterium]
MTHGLRHPRRASRRAAALVAVVLLAALVTSCTSADGSGGGGASGGGPGTTVPVQGDGTFPGDYRIRGTNPDRSRYRGTLTIDGDEAGPLALDWDTNGSYEGVGVAEGDILAATHGDDGTACNAAIYPIGPDDTLDGRWVTYDGRGPIDEAVAAVIPGGPGVTGSYAIEGTNADGVEYSGSMDIVDAGEAFEITRQVGGFLATGSALRVGNVLVVGFGDRTCAAVGYTMGPNGHLTGEWGATGVQNLGRERVTPDD